MAEYIRKQDAVEALDGKIIVTGRENADAVLQYMKDITNKIKSIEPADVASVRHGTWLPIVSYNNTYKCSECGRLLVNITDGLNMVAKHYPYCHCGAKMDGSEQKQKAAETIN